MYRLALFAAIIALGVVGVQTANAWHAVDVQVGAKCNPQTGVYDITATIVQSEEWPGAYIKTITPTTLPGSTAGPRFVVVVIGWTTSSETQTFKRFVTPDGKCAVVCEPQIVERVVYVDRPVEVVREVVKEVPVVKTVTKVVVKWRTKVVTKWKTRTVYKTKTKVIHDRCVPPPDDPDCEGKCDWPKKYGGNG